MRAVDLTGKVFGRLTVVSLSGVAASKKRIWSCQCVCGASIETSGSNLTTGNTQSCGCFRKEATGDARRTHGMSKSVEYDAWMRLRDRCANPKNKSYPDYGGRGIECRFISFEEFLADIGPKPDPDLTVERIQNDRHYERGNVRWATRLEQAQNRSPRSCKRKPR